MSRTTPELKDEIQRTLALMRTQRDEIRVQLHLARMDVAQEWRKLEPELAKLERAASDVTEATLTALTHAVSRLAKLRSSLK